MKRTKQAESDLRKIFFGFLFFGVIIFLAMKFG
jgi:hypothetical protein